MPIIKVSSIKSNITITGITSSNVSSSVSGNMNLIQSQIKEKTNEYINIKNAVNILERYSNWNGYIKLYTEVESNFDVNDIVYITYTTPVTGSTIFNLDNNYNNVTQEYYNDPFDENISNYSLGYKILYTNKYKNELVINRYYNDITPGYTLSNQCLSKITCRKGNFFSDVSDGVVFYGGCNIFNDNFSVVQGIVSGSTISGATISCSDFSTTSDENGFYSINLPAGSNYITVSAASYITSGFTTTVINGQINTLNVLLTKVVTTTTTTAPTTTTTTTYFPTTTYMPTTTLIPLDFFEIFGKLYSL